MRYRKSDRNAFTLVELLVVIGIIALLIAILLPSLGKARRQANTVKDLSNLRSLTQAMIIYTVNYKGYLPGSPLTSGVNITDSNSPGINQCFDWASPLFDIMGYHVPYSATADIGRSNPQAKWDRVKYQLNSQLMTCPENAIVAPMYAPSTAFPGVAEASSVQPFMSYSSAIVMMVGSNPVPSSSADPSISSPYGNQYENPPAGYVPKITKIGAAEKKCFIADGARYVKAGTAIDMDFDYAGSVGGEYADWGAHSQYSYGRSRSGARANGNVQPDLRVTWARHGNGINQFRFNLAFYDGHAETMSDLDGSNPVFWAPKGTSIQRSELWPDTLAKFGGAGAGNYIVPE